MKKEPKGTLGRREFLRALGAGATVTAAAADAITVITSNPRKIFGLMIALPDP